MCYITATLKMRVSALLFARVGHTHGPLGYSAETSMSGNHCSNSLDQTTDDRIDVTMMLKHVETC